LKKKLVIVTTHPIQYQIPWFRGLEETGLYELTVLFGMLPDSAQQAVGFGKDFSWDIPLLEGYRWKVLENYSKNPGLDDFSGINVPSIGSELKSLKPDVVILTGWQSKMLIQAAVAAKIRGIPMVMRGDSNAMQLRPFYKRYLHQVFLKLFDAFITVGSSNRQFYYENSVSDAKLFDAPHFVDNARFLQTIEEKGTKIDELRSRLQIPESKFCFVYAGKLIDKKNVGELLKGFLMLCEKEKINNSDEGLTSHLLIIGDGEHRSELELSAVEKNLPVTFAGFINQSDLPLYYAIGNCFLLCSDYGETWGLVVNEAMICGMPAIVSDRVGCGPDLIIEGQTGFVYSYGDPSHLARLMYEVSHDVELATTLGNFAKKHVKKNFTLQASVDSTQKAIEYVTG
jgi:glycosyltransferase involved in cell wall biosynthesis